MLDPEPVDAVLDEAAASLKACYPAFAGMQIAERWAGVIDVMPDVVPVMSALAEARGALSCLGLFRPWLWPGPGGGQADGADGAGGGALR